MIREVINGQMDELGIPYEYWEYSGDARCYFVGEEIEAPRTQEDGCQSGTFVLSGWSLQGLPVLLDYQALVKRAFSGGVRIPTDEGAVYAEYSHTLNVPSDVEGACRLEITINYKEWSVI